MFSSIQGNASQNYNKRLVQTYQIVKNVKNWLIPNTGKDVDQ